MAHALFVGPSITGTVTLPDGTEVDVSPDVLYLPTLADVEVVADAIGRHLAEHGHPTDPTFTYTPSQEG